MPSSFSFSCFRLRRLPTFGSSAGGAAPGTTLALIPLSVIPLTLTPLGAGELWRGASRNDKLVVEPLRGVLDPFGVANPPSSSRLNMDGVVVPLAPGGRYAPVALTGVGFSVL